jgi:hypothetical protein
MVAVALPDVVHGDDSGFGRLMERVASERELVELVRFLAQCADVGELAVRAGTAVPPKAAHRVFERLRVARQPVPLHIREGERAYQAARKREQRRAA